VHRVLAALFVVAGTAAAAPPPASDPPDSLDRDIITRGVDKVRPQIRACGDKSSAKGKVRLSVKVAPAGNTTNIEVKSTPDAALGNCVAAAMQHATFERTKNGGAFAIPFVF